MRPVGFLLVACAAVPSCTVGGRTDDATAALMAGDLAGAERDFRWVLEREPDHCDALYGLGWTYYRDADPGRAEGYFKRAQRVCPTDYRGFKGLGAVAASRGRLPEAETWYGEALQRAPDEPTLHNALASIDLASGACDAALVHAEDAVSRAPERGEFRFTLAETQICQGRLDDALKTIDQALSATLQEKRFRAQLLELRARVLVRKTSGVVDATDCASTAPPVLAYLDAAERLLDQAEAEAAGSATVADARRLVYRRRSVVTETCPQTDSE